MSRQQRFGVWIIAVAAAIAAPLWLHVGMTGGSFLGAVTGLSGLSVILLLLATTPGDAIRLPRWGNVGAVGGGTGAIALLAGAPAVAAAALALVGALMSEMARHRVFSRDPHSPWVYTLLLWHPGFWAEPVTAGAGSSAESLVADAFWMVLLGTLVTVGALTPAQTPRGALPWARAAVAVGAWQLAGAVTLWVTWTFGR